MKYPCRGKYNLYSTKMIRTPGKLLKRVGTIYGESREGKCYRIHWDGTVSRKNVLKEFIVIIKYNENN